MLFDILLDSITILFCFFFLFLVVFSFLIIPAEIENARLKLALTIPTAAPITDENYEIEMLPLTRDKTINDLSKYSKEAIYFLSLLLINSLSLISSTK